MSGASTAASPEKVRPEERRGQEIRGQEITLSGDLISGFCSGMNRGMAATPTARTLAAMRREGWTVQVVERWNPHARIRQDLFGWADLLAVHPGDVASWMEAGGPPEQCRTITGPVPDAAAPHPPCESVQGAGATPAYPSTPNAGTGDPAASESKPALPSNVQSMLDLFGPVPGIVGVQVTSASGMAARRRKMLGTPDLVPWLLAGGKALLGGWVKRGNRWRWAAEVVSMGAAGPEAGPRTEWVKPPGKARGVGSPRGTDPPVPAGG